MSFQPPPLTLLEICHQRGITLEARDGQIRCRAKKGVLTPEIQHDITIHKAELLHLLEATHPNRTWPIKHLASPHGRIEINWDGQVLVGPLLAFDTETTMPKGQDDHSIQRLVLATVCDGQRRIVLPPEQLEDFFLAHRTHTWVFYNIAFDFWVLHSYFQRTGANAVVDLLWSMASRGQFRDAMLLDQLLTIAVMGKADRYRSLEDAASYYTNITLDKAGNLQYREHYADLLGVPLVDVKDRGWFDYAADDTLATLHVYLEQLRQAQDLLAQHRTLKSDLNEQTQRWGPLTECIQVMAAIALDQPYRSGLHVDPERQRQIRQHLSQDIHRAAKAVNAMVQLPPYSEHIAAGEPFYRIQPSGKVSRSSLVLQAILEKVVLPHLESALPDKPRIPRTEKTNSLSVSRQHWEEFASTHPFIENWLRIEEQSKLLMFVQDTPAIIHPRYQTLVSSGRTSCRKPNIQQLPRDGGIREMILPPPGHVFLASDYETLELRTFASICLDRFGESQLAKVFDQGIDPHAYTASLLLGMTYEQFMALKKTDEKRFKDERQKAKAINFGTPAGLGVASLVTYAKHTYGVTFTFEEAKQLREKLITEIYPEMGWYLEDDSMTSLAWNFGCDVDELWKLLNWEADNKRPGYVPGFYKRILRGQTTNSEGRPYNQSTLDNAWEKLRLAARNNPKLQASMTNGGSEDLLLACTGSPAITTTGRIRGGCQYTQVRNVPFQGLAADGAKLAVFELMRQGWQVAIFVHDEIIVCVPEGSDYTVIGKDLVAIMVNSMQRVVPNVEIAASQAVVMRYWSKDAVAVQDAAGNVIPWTAQ